MKIERYKATLLGCAIGDTLGMPVEGWKKEQIKKYVGRIIEPIDPIIVADSSGKQIEKDEYGKLKFYSKGLKKGEWTDDTILTIALAESLGEKGYPDINDIAQKQLKAYEDSIRPDNSDPGFGKTTRDAFENLKKGISPLNSGVIGGPGNAPAMKMSPLGLYMDATGNYNLGLTKAEHIGRITHLDPRSIALGIVQAHAIYTLLQNVSREEFLDSVLEVSSKYEKPLTKEFNVYEKGNLTSRIKWIRDNKDSECETAFNLIKNSSLGFESYPFSLFMLQKYWNNTLEGLIETVNFGGDCDTTGAIYGTLAGAKDGMIFKEDWINVLDKKDKIINLATKIYNLGDKK